MTMTFAISALGTVGLGIVHRRYPGSFREGPPYPFFMWLAIPAIITWFGAELPFLQGLLDTVGLSTSQWLIVISLSVITPILVEVEKSWRRRQLAQ